MNTVIPTEVELHQDTKNELLKKSIHKTRLKIKKKTKERNESPIAHHRHLAERRKSGAISKSVA